MSDTLDLRAMELALKQERREAWENRFPEIAKIERAGFQVRTVNEQTRHLRIDVRGDGWFDWFPSTGRWEQSRRRGGAKGLYGFGTEELIAALAKTAGTR